MMFHIFKKHSLMVSLFLIGLGIYLFTRFINQHYIDYLWFQSQGYDQLWWSYLKIKYSHYILGFLIAGTGYFLSFTYAKLRMGKQFKLTRFEIIIITLGILFALAFIHAPTFLNLWEARIMANADVLYGKTDPIYGQDISFYILQLEYYLQLIQWLMFTLVFMGIATLGIYLVPLLSMDSLQFEEKSGDVVSSLKFAVPHLTLFLCVFLLTAAVNFYFGRYQLLIEGSSEKVAGASYMDIYAKATGSLVMAYASAVLAFVLGITIVMKRFRWSLYVSGAWLVTYIFILKVLPMAVYYTKVYSNQYQAEKEFIAHSINFTREAYDLHKIKKLEFPAKKKLSNDDIQKNQLTLKNLRIWDYKPLQKTFSQLQEFRQYYQFSDIDIDRYQINGEMRQVLISGRELNQNKLPNPAQTWESRHLQYTHGYGLVISPSNQFNSAGQPNLWVKDMPPKTLDSLDGLPQIKDPSIYFGELTNTYAIVNTSLEEIHYPTADRFAATRYDEKTAGVTLGPALSLRRLSFALAEGSWKFLLSEYINDDSQILYYRNIFQIVRKLAPFLTYDPDPYLVLSKDGKLYWILDAYTLSHRFPYSEHLGKLNRPIDTLSQYKKINYIRNSVKIVIDAKTGETKFYAFSDNEIILAAWQKYLPDLFYSRSEFPENLTSHIRYPENLFRIQANVYGDYHTDDTQTFYNLEDLWQLPRDEIGGQREPYYSVVKIPNEVKEEYLLMTPFLAYNKENMITWLLARSDYSVDEKENRYGQLILFDFPRTKQIYGPRQIEARTDQDPEISKDLTLWNQQGSNVIRGQLLIVPVGDALLYTQSIYLESSSSPLPELRRIVASDGNSLVMTNNLSEAVQQLANRQEFDINKIQGFESSTGDKDSDQRLTAEQRLNKARQLLDQAQQLLKDGNWGEFGKAMDDLNKTVRTR